MELENKLNELIARGATAAQLASIRDGWGPERLSEGTWLHAAVHRGLLPLIAGGATAAELASFKDDCGRSALSVAAYSCLDHVKGGVTAADLKQDVAKGLYRARSSLFIAIKHGQAKHIQGPIRKRCLTADELSDALLYQCKGFYDLPDVPTVKLLMRLGASRKSLRGYISRCRSKLRQAVQTNSQSRDFLFQRLRILTALAEESGMRVRHPADVVSLLL